MKLTKKQLRKLINEEVDEAESEALLRQTIREAVLTEVTVGELKKTLALIKKEKNIQRAKAAAKAAAEAGVGLALDAFTLGGASFLKKAWDIGGTVKDVVFAVTDLEPNVKKANPIMDKLTIDPNTAAIVDNEVEARFVKDLAAAVDRLPDSTEIPDADKALADWLKGKFSGAHVTK